MANGTGAWMGRPNAIIVAGGARAKPGQKTHPADDDTAVVVTLGSPRVKDNGDVAFNVTVVPASTELGGGIAKNYLAAARGDKPPPAGFWTSIPVSKKTLESVSLFVDGAWRWRELVRRCALPALRLLFLWRCFAQVGREGQKTTDTHTHIHPPSIPSQQTTTWRNPPPGRLLLLLLHHHPRARLTMLPGTNATMTRCGTASRVPNPWTRMGVGSRGVVGMAGLGVGACLAFHLGGEGKAFF